LEKLEKFFKKQLTSGSDFANISKRSRDRPKPDGGRGETPADVEKTVKKLLDKRMKLWYHS